MATGVKPQPLPLPMITPCKRGFVHHQAEQAGASSPSPQARFREDQPTGTSNKNGMGLIKSSRVAVSLGLISDCLSLLYANTLANGVNL